MPLVEVSNGELADKWTIIEIKAALLVNPDQLKNLSIEASSLEPMIAELKENSNVQLLIAQLKETNLVIWNLMEKLYELHANMDSTYLSLSIEITEYNQKRAFLKKEIDALSQSLFSEAKSFFENPAFVINSQKIEN
jgi:hypothetical protein